MTEITHADQLTGSHFKEMLRKPVTWVWILGLTLVAGLGFGIFGSPVAGAVAAAVVLVIGIIVVYGMADSKAEEAFFDAYAKSRGLKRDARDLKQLTPLLRKGDERETKQQFVGKLDDQFSGSLALYTYTEITRDHKGNEQRSDYPFTLVLIELPETVEHLPELLVEKQSGFDFLEGLEDKFRGNHERVKLESEALDQRFEIFVRKDQDPVWVRRLFSPSFIVWLTEHPARDLAFEMVNGNLVTFVPKHKESSGELDQMISVGCEVAAKIRAEAVS